MIKKVLVNLTLYFSSESFFLGIITAFLIIGGLGISTELINSLAAIFSVVLLLFLVIKKGELQLPKYFSLFIIFLLFFGLSLIWSVDFARSLSFFALFIAGAIFWLLFYNHKLNFSNWFEKIIIVLGLIFGILFFFKGIYKGGLIQDFSLFFYFSINRAHNHIGDLWALISLIVFYRLTSNQRKFLYWLLLPICIYFLFISMSRSAYIALSAGIIFVTFKRGLFRKYKLVFFIFISVILSLFFYIATKKSLLFSRPYIVQSLVAMKNYPLGVGVGNFGFISKDSKNHILGLSGYSRYTFSLPFEMAAGLGILSIVFLYFLVRVTYDLVVSGNEDTLLYRAIFLCLTVNFLFDYTYFIPTMLWLWFLSLGLVQSAK